VTDRTFDRLERFDERSRGYPISAVAPLTAQTVVWPCPTWLDQGSEGACVGHAISHALACPPEPRIVDSLFARNLYFEAQKIDQFPGGEYAGADPRMSGTSVLAGFRVAHREKYVGAYRWAFGPAELCNGLSTGPAVLGVRWHAGMSNPGRDGLVRPLGSVLGGHAICCRGYDAQRKLFILRNSWGRDWGADGDCLVSFDDMASLLADGGEACFPLKGAAANKTLVHKLAALFGCR
jgi:hypothetical protein